MSHDELRMARRKAIGTKQTIKALERGEAKTVYLAEDAEKRVTKSVLELCKANGVEITYVNTMAQLGKACGIEVGAASVAILID
ncbi:MAG: 50S ribosomal protein L7Ae-like protein [Firmicutes bacterium]|jgi:large subunit ribosomal protein L7A|nr:50S ribosomal protein L7Ae-like protein [Bacillota bacterium]